MTATRAFVIILVTAVCTLITRLVPFMLFGRKKETIILARFCPRRLWQLWWSIV